MWHPNTHVRCRMSPVIHESSLCMFWRSPVLFRRLYDAYSFQMIPVLGEVIAGDWKSYQYLVESIRKFPDQVSHFLFLLLFFGIKIRVDIPCLLLYKAPCFVVLAGRVQRDDWGRRLLSCQILQSHRGCGCHSLGLQAVRDERSWLVPSWLNTHWPLSRRCTTDCPPGSRTWWLLYVFAGPLICSAPRGTQG